MIVPVSPTGTIKLYSKSGAHLLADVSGYFTDATAPDTDDGLFVPLVPARLLDSRDDGPPIAPGATTGFAVNGRLGIPTTANAVVLNLTAVRSIERGFVTGWPSDESQPGSSNLDVRTRRQHRQPRRAPAAASLRRDQLVHTRWRPPARRHIRLLPLVPRRSPPTATLLHAMNLKQHLRRYLDRIVSPVVSAAIRSYYGDYYYSNKWHPHYALLHDALAETVEYIKSDMPDAMIRKDAFSVLSMASKQARIDGMYLEFGVRSGSTINHLARLNPKHTIHGFDSFDGLPEAWSGYTMDVGAFSGEGMPEVAPNVELHVGWFDDTLPSFVEQHDGPLGARPHRLRHLQLVQDGARQSRDTDRARLGDRVQRYFNYPNWKQHEYRAFQEFCETHQVEYEYLCWALYEVAVKVTAVGAPR